jgi:hypothetical protein
MRNRRARSTAERARYGPGRRSPVPHGRAAPPRAPVRPGSGAPREGPVGTGAHLLDRPPSRRCRPGVGHARGPGGVPGRRGLAPERHPPYGPRVRDPAPADRAPPRPTAAHATCVHTPGAQGCRYRHVRGADRFGRRERDAAGRPRGQSRPRPPGLPDGARGLAPRVRGAAGRRVWTRASPVCSPGRSAPVVPGRHPLPRALRLTSCCPGTDGFRSAAGRGRGTAGNRRGT